MENNTLKILSKNYLYTIACNNPNPNLKHRIFYSNGDDLGYGDPAEIMSSIQEDRILNFFDEVLHEKEYYTQFISIFYGYIDGDYENETVEKDEVAIYYLGAYNIIKKSNFFETCLLLCDAKINSLQYGPNEYFTKDQLLELRPKLLKKMAEYL